MSFISALKTRISSYRKRAQVVDCRSNHVAGKVNLPFTKVFVSPEEIATHHAAYIRLDGLKSRMRIKRKKARKAQRLARKITRYYCT